MFCARKLSDHLGTREVQKELRGDRLAIGYKPSGHPSGERSSASGTNRIGPKLRSGAQEQEEESINPTCRLQLAWAYS